MYAICQTQNNIESIIDVVDQEKDFLQVIINLVKNMPNNNYQQIDNSFTSNIKYDAKFGQGKYLLVNPREIIFVEKYQNISMGWVYNATMTNVNILYVWRLINISDTLKIKKSDNAFSSIDNYVSCIKNFNMDSIKEYPTIMVVTKNNDDDLKIRLLEQLLLKLNVTNCNNFMDNSLLISSDETFNELCAKKYPKMVESKTQDNNLIGEHLNKYNGCIIVNECREPMCDNLVGAIMNGRHYNMAVIIFKQASDQDSRNIRNDLNYIFLGYEESDENNKLIHDQYCSFFPTLKSYQTIYTKVRENYNFMVVNNINVMNNIKGKIFKLTL